MQSHHRSSGCLNCLTLANASARQIKISSRANQTISRDRQFNSFQLAHATVQQRRESAQHWYVGASEAPPRPGPCLPPRWRRASTRRQFGRERSHCEVETPPSHAPAATPRRGCIPLQEYPSARRTARPIETAGPFKQVTAPRVSQGPRRAL